MQAATQERYVNRVSLLAYKAMHAESGAERAQAYQQGLATRGFTVQDLCSIRDYAPDAYIRHAAKTDAYLLQLGFLSCEADNASEDNLELLVLQPTSESAADTQSDSRRPEEPEQLVYQEAI